MINPTRRHLLYTTAGLAAFLTACAGQTLSQLAADAAALANAAQTFLASVPASVIPAADQPAITQTTATIATVSTTIASATSSTTGSLVSQLVAAAEELLPIAAGIVVGPAGSLAAQLAVAGIQALVGAIKGDAGAVGIALPAGAAVVPNAAVAALPAMSVAEARARFGQVK